ncbi:hypothetical protein K2X33_01100 [bacterium]|nr:hypothetical protein [bacterium]
MAALFSLALCFALVFAAPSPNIHKNPAPQTILFLIDDSGSAETLVPYLVKAMPAFLKQLDRESLSWSIVAYPFDPTSKTRITIDVEKAQNAEARKEFLHLLSSWDRNGPGVEVPFEHLEVLSREKLVAVGKPLTIILVTDTDDGSNVDESLLLSGFSAQTGEGRLKIHGIFGGKTFDCPDTGDFALVYPNSKFQKLIGPTGGIARSLCKDLDASLARIARLLPR